MQNILARKTRALVGEKRIIEDASLIKVQVIKKKYVDQIKEINVKVSDSFTDLEMIILGRCDQWIIFTDKTKALQKMSRVDFIQYSIEEDPRTRDVGDRERRKVSKPLADAIGKMLNKIPQLFAE